MCERNQELITNKFNGPDGKSRGNALWQTLTQRLNSMGYGEKSKEEWRKAFTDWRCKTKRKAAKLRTEQNKTGGGSAVGIPLSILECKLIDLMGARAVVRDHSEELRFGQVTIEVPLNETFEDPQNDTKDHSYYGDVKIEEKEISNCSSSTRGTTRSTNNEPYRRTRRQTDRLSKKLLEANQETNEILKEMRDSIKSMANSLKIIAESIAKRSK